MTQATVSEYVVPQKLAAVLKSGWITRNEIGVPIWWEREPIKRDRQGIFCGEWDHSSENWRSHAMMLVGIDDKLLPPIEIPWEQCKFPVTVEIKEPTKPEFEKDSRVIYVRASTEEDAESAVRLQVPKLGTPHPTKPHLLLLKREVHKPTLSKWGFFSTSEYKSVARLAYANRDVSIPPDRLPLLLINDCIPYKTALDGLRETPIEIHNVKRVESPEGCVMGTYTGYWRGKTVTFNTSAGTYEGRVDVENNDDPVCIVTVGRDGYSVAKTRYMRENK